MEKTLIELLSGKPPHKGMTDAEICKIVDPFFYALLRATDEVLKESEKVRVSEKQKSKQLKLF